MDGPLNTTGKNIEFNVLNNIMDDDSSISASSLYKHGIRFVHNLQNFFF